FFVAHVRSFSVRRGARAGGKPKECELVFRSHRSPDRITGWSLTTSSYRCSGSRCNAGAAPATVTGDESRCARSAHCAKAWEGRREEDDPEARRPTAHERNLSQLRREVIVSLLAVLFFLAQQQLNQTIIVTASEVPETLESTPASVTVITKSDIEA